MAKISLREYIREIENLIDRGETDQAISHCKHILNYYPKHIDTYRLLGKAFLEKQKYGDAADIFQRVLSSVPDDFISQIGMSIIREDENNLDAAIWHMERAFEVQPSNKAVQDELRRLYANRDGIAPPKIRLTRGALVRMYTRGDLYTQAIAEIRAALVEDPNRTDLEVILARLYFLQGQFVEASESCSKLIAKLPYCYEANRILTEILPGTNRAEDEKIFRQRVNDLDPYNQFISEAIRKTADVPDNAVMVDYLEWDATQIETGQPDWAQSIGIDISEDQTEDENLILWEDSSSDEEDSPVFNFNQQTIDKTPPSHESATENPEETDFSTSLFPQESEDESEEIPAWMKEAGWEVSDEDNIDAEKGFNIDIGDVEMPQASAEMGLAPAEIPDWLQGMAPQMPNLDEDDDAEGQDIDTFAKLFDSGDQSQQNSKKTTPEMPDFTAESDETIPGWLRDMDFDQDLTPTSDSLMENKAEGAFAWLQDNDQTSEKSLKIDDEDSNLIDNLSIPDQEMDQPSTSEEAAPDWLAGLTDETQSSATISTSDSDDLAPDWLNNLSQPDEVSEIPPSESPHEQPEWLKGLVEEEDSAPSFSIEETQEETPDWLSDITKETGEFKEAFSEEMGDLETIAETDREAESSEAIPDWLSEITKETGETKEAFSEELGDLETIAETDREAEPSEAIPDWLSDITKETGETKEAFPEEVGNLVSFAEIDLEAESSEVIPDWLSDITKETGEIKEAFPEELGNLETIAETDREAESSEDIPDWLSEITKETGETKEAFSEELGDLESFAETDHEAEPSESIPDWLSDITKEDLTGESTHQPEADQLQWVEVTSFEEKLPEEPQKDTPEATLPDWLSEIEEEQEPAPSQLEETKIEQTTGIPDWLNDLTSEEMEEGTPQIVGSDQAKSTEIPSPSEEEDLAWVSEYPQDDSTVSDQEFQIKPAEVDQIAALDNEDDAFAWLEALAAKQGADSETLLTKDENRDDTIPDWIKETLDETEAPIQKNPITQPQNEQEPIEETVPDEFETDQNIASEEMASPILEIDEPEEFEAALSVEEISESASESQEIPSTFDASAIEGMDIESALAWMEGLAAKQGAEEETLFAQPEDRSEEPPEWISEEAQQIIQHQLDDESDEEENLLEGLAASLISEQVIDKNDEHEGTASFETIQTEEVEPQFTEAEPSEIVSEQAEILEDTPTEIEEFEEISLVQDDEVSSETIPGIDSSIEIDSASLDQFIEETFQETVNLEDSEQDTQEIPVQETVTETVNIIEEVVPVSSEIEESGITNQLTLAKQALHKGNFSEAITLYNELIAAELVLDQVITDITEALSFHYPIEISLWQALGDAYLRNDQLDEALNAYSKAEELIQT